MHGENLKLIHVLIIVSSKNTGPMILRALTAHQTPNSTSCIRN